jgi:hypothetical protein
MMSLAKSVPDGLKPQKCKRLHIPEPPPVPYVPIKDEVQKEVFKMQNLQIKTLLKKDTTLIFPMWHNNETKEAFLMHLTAVLDDIKKRGHIKDYEKAQKAYVEHKQAVKSAKAGLALLGRTSKGVGKSRKAKKAKAKAKDAKARAKKAKAKSTEAEGATKIPKDPMKAAFQADIEKAKKAPKDAQGTMTAAASEMFAFYLNLLSPESKYLWNMIVVKQTEVDPSVNLQGVSLKGPRGMSRESFDNA